MRTKRSTEIVLYDLRIIEQEGGRRLADGVTLATLLRSALTRLSKDNNNLLLGRRKFDSRRESRQVELFDDLPPAFFAHPTGDSLSISLADFVIKPSPEQPDIFHFLFKLIDPTVTDPAFADRKKGTTRQVKPEVHEAASFSCHMYVHCVGRFAARAVFESGARIAPSQLRDWLAAATRDDRQTATGTGKFPMLSLVPADVERAIANDRSSVQAVTFLDRASAAQTRPGGVEIDPLPRSERPNVGLLGTVQQLAANKLAKFKSRRLEVQLFGNDSELTRQNLNQLCRAAETDGYSESVLVIRSRGGKLRKLSLGITDDFTMATLAPWEDVTGLQPQLKQDDEHLHPQLIARMGEFCARYLRQSDDEPQPARPGD